MVAPYLCVWNVAASEGDIKSVGGRRGGSTNQQGKVGSAVIIQYISDYHVYQVGDEKKDLLLIRLVSFYL